MHTCGMVIRFLFSAAALGFATWVVPGISMRDSEPQNAVMGILLVVIIFAVNALVKPLFVSRPRRCCCSRWACFCW